jgi:SAM-dependent methyltransferase
MQALEAKYGTDKYGMFSHMLRIPVSIGEHHNDYSCLSGKKILEIGCGNCEDIDGDSSSPRMFEPWVCRAFALCGAEPVGIDNGKNKLEEFPIYRRDISAKGALDFLPSGSFDMVCSFFLLPPKTSPALATAVVKSQRYRQWYQLTQTIAAGKGQDIVHFVESNLGNELKDVPDILGKLDPTKTLLAYGFLKSEVMPEIFAQVNRVLKDDGYFFLDKVTYQKVNGELAEKEPVNAF